MNRSNLQAESYAQNYTESFISGIEKGKKAVEIYMANRQSQGRGLSSERTRAMAILFNLAMEDARNIGEIHSTQESAAEAYGGYVEVTDAFVKLERGTL